MAKHIEPFIKQTEVEQAISDRTGYKKKEVKAILAAFSDVIVDSISMGVDVEFGAGFFTFRDIPPKPDKMMRDMQTGVEMLRKINGYRKVRFKVKPHSNAYKAIKESVTVTYEDYIKEHPEYPALLEQKRKLREQNEE